MGKRDSEQVPAGAKEDGRRGKKRRVESKEPFISNIPWPSHFTQLQKCFRALNTVYTFCSAKKRTSTTFEGMKASVEELIKRELTIQDLAELRALLPDIISFAYMNREAIKVHLEAKQPGSLKGREIEKEDPYTSIDPPVDEEEHVLFFNFSDGDVASSNRYKEPTVKGMSSLITKRNLKFDEAVSSLLLGCSSATPTPLDPLLILQHAALEHIPIRPSEIHRTEQLSTKSDLVADTQFYITHGRPSIQSLVEDLRTSDTYKDQIVQGGRTIVNARDAVFGELEFRIPEYLGQALQRKGIEKLYSHQTEALNYLFHPDVEGVIVTTSTSSGKSIIYQLPSILELKNDANAKAFYVFPTKALAQDQMRSLAELLRNCGPSMEFVKIATFDGDTAKEDRDFIRENASILFVNPDILHVTILPQEEKWRHFLRNLRVVVLDELHVYNGLFGTHVAFVMRRLKRLCAAVGNRDVKFIACSATVANPVEHMQTLFGITSVKSVEKDGSQSGRKEHIVWNPPFVDTNDHKQGRVSAIGEASRLFRFFLAKGVRTIVFCRVRKLCEIVMKTVTADLLAEERQDLCAKVASYRGGYSPQERRRIEKEMFDGELLGIIATSALELGIDIGSLDAVITVGFPYTLPALRQQAGRAGRRNKDSLSMLVCDSFPMDQHYASNPSEIHTAPNTSVCLDLKNPLVLEGHLQCAAHEMPLREDEDQVYFGEEMVEICRTRLVKDPYNFYHCHPNFQPRPAWNVKIRATEDDTYKIISVTGDGGQVLEEVEWSRAVFEAYEGSVFLHQGKTYIVGEVDHDRKVAMVRRKDVDWTTRQRDYTDVDALEIQRIRDIRGGVARAYYGKIRVTSKVFGYFKVDRLKRVLDTVDVDSPPFEREGVGMWIDVPRSCIEILRQKGFHVAGAIHAANHAIMSLTPIFAMSIHGDVRTECKAPQKELSAKKSKRKRPARLILYDNCGKSGGLSSKVFDHISSLLSTAERTISDCPCENGCPSCVASSHCSEGNIVLAKLGCLIVIRCLLGISINIEEIPQQAPIEVIYGRADGPIDDSIVIEGEVKRADHVEVYNSEVD